MILNIDVLFPNPRIAQESEKDTNKSSTDSIREAKAKVQRIIEDGKNRRK